jgi:hypothetical protein
MKIKVILEDSDGQLLDTIHIECELDDTNEIREFLENEIEREFLEREKD